MPLDPEWWANGPSDPFRDNTNGDINAGTLRSFAGHVSTRIDNGGPTYVVDYVGVIGPGVDELHATSSAMFGDFAIAWGPDYLLYQTPWSTWDSVQAQEGETLACAAYLEPGYVANVANEVIWKLVDGEWVVDTDQPVTPGATVTTRNPLDVTWLTGLFMVSDGEGRLESVAMQQTRAHVARMSAPRTVSVDGSDEDDAGNPWGTVLVDTNDGPVTRTLPSIVYPGREIVYINKGTGVVTVEAPPGVGLYGSPTISEQYGWSAFVFDGTDWYARSGPSA